ncbi:MAG: NAD(P)-dependent alcohol dehydrogenase [Dactylosporangium sp.]|nr:NAD(P)-dependent alcohol dehydrogenase [Dactylosporangium sp.]NNJ59853.1 NAD(P)-dependent alcohol dehydrogenase [Dactylosporangium sp.]
MVAAGLCHTDLSVQAGNVPFAMPGVLGHEGAGVVEAVGDAVTTVAPGDAVLLSFTSCGRCRSCRTGRPALCELWLPMNLLDGARADGSATLHRLDGDELHGHFFGQSSFASHALADERSAVRVAQEDLLAVLAPLGCGVQTGAGTVFNVLRPTPGASIAVVGAGAVGLSAVMAAALTPATTIIAVDRIPWRLDLARELGATDTIDVNEVSLGEALRQITAGRGVDLALDATGDTGVIATTAAALAVGGTLALVGAPPFGATIPTDVNGMLPGRSVVGVTEGDADPHVLVPVLARLYHQGRFPVDRLVRTYDFADIQSAAQDLHSGHTIKPVLLFDPDQSART